MLNESQRRRIGVRLGAVASGARGFLQLIDRAGSRSAAESTVLSTLRLDLDRLLELVDGAAARLGVSIEPPQDDLERQIDTWALTAWVQLIDCLPERFTGSGPLDPEAATVLSEAVTGVTRQLERIQAHGERGNPQVNAPPDRPADGSGTHEEYGIRPEGLEPPAF